MAQTISKGGQKGIFLEKKEKAKLARTCVGGEWIEQVVGQDS